MGASPRMTRGWWYQQIEESLQIEDGGSSKMIQMVAFQWKRAPSTEETSFCLEGTCFNTSQNSSMIHRRLQGLIGLMHSIPPMFTSKDCVVVSNIFYFHPYLGKIPNLTNICQIGWNHPLEKITARSPRKYGSLRLQLVLSQVINGASACTFNNFYSCLVSKRVGERQAVLGATSAVLNHEFNCKWLPSPKTKIA